MGLLKLENGCRLIGGFDGTRCDLVYIDLIFFTNARMAPAQVFPSESRTAFGEEWHLSFTNFIPTMRMS
jgi:hypothetical protein